MIWVWLLRKDLLRNVLICKIFLASGIVSLLLVRQAVVRQQFGKLCCNHWRDTVKMDKLILLIQKQLTSINCLVATLNPRNGEMVCCPSSWKTKISASKNTKRPMSTNGRYSMVMLILYGLSHSTQSWMITKCIFRPAKQVRQAEILVLVLF